MTRQLTGNANALQSAIVDPVDGTVACRIVTDGQHRGALFAWLGDYWVVTDVDGLKCLGLFERLAVVSLEVDADADDGLNQTAIGFDLDAGEWVVPADDLPGLRDTYGKALVVRWEQSEDA